MEPVDVLRDDVPDQAEVLQPPDRRVRPIWLRRRKARPPGITSSPVSSASGRASHELTELNRLVAAPGTAGAPVVRNPRFGAAAGAGEDDDAPGGGDEPGERGSRAIDVVRRNSCLAHGRPVPAQNFATSETPVVVSVSSNPATGSFR